MKYWIKKYQWTVWSSIGPYMSSKYTRKFDAEETMLKYVLQLEDRKDCIGQMNESYEFAISYLPETIRYEPFPLCLGDVTYKTYNLDGFFYVCNTSNFVPTLNDFSIKMFFGPDLLEFFRLNISGSTSLLNTASGRIGHFREAKDIILVSNLCCITEAEGRELIDLAATFGKQVVNYTDSLRLIP